MSDTKITKQEISAWLVDWIANELKMKPEEIETERSLLEYSLSSVTATILVGDIEDWLDLRLPPTLVWDYPSIDAMSDHLVSEMAAGTEDGRTAALPTGEPEGERDAAQLLENLDKLSEEEVDALLKELEGQEVS